MIEQLHYPFQNNEIKTANSKLILFIIIGIAIIAGAGYTSYVSKKKI